MKSIRKITVFPLEVLLMVLVAVFVISECACMALGGLCRLIEGKQ